MTVVGLIYRPKPFLSGRRRKLDERRLPLVRDNLLRLKSVESVDERAVGVPAINQPAYVCEGFCTPPLSPAVAWSLSPPLKRRGVIFYFELTSITFFLSGSSGLKRSGREVH
jgi:hypothetical protein